MRPPIQAWAAFLAAASFALVSGIASAQSAASHAFPPVDPGAESAIADLLPGPATLRGQIVHETHPEAGADAPVILYTLSSGGVPRLRSTSADPQGRFAFEGIRNDPETVYLLGARYLGVPFGLAVSFEPDELEHDVELLIADPTTEIAAAAVAEVQVRVHSSCTGVYLQETHVLENSSDRVIYIPQEQRGERDPIVRIALPLGAGQLESTIEDNLEWDGRTVSFWGPLRPGREEIVFAYGISSDGASLRVTRDFASGARSLRLLSHPDGPALSATRGAGALQAGDPVELDGELFGVLAADDIARGERVTLELVPLEVARPKGIEVDHSRIWLEFDGAALDVDEQHRWSVDRPLQSDSGAPLLCMTLPAGASELLFSSQALALGLTRDPSGAIAIRGPIPAGDLEFSLSYQLPKQDEGAVFVRELPLETPLLSVLVADTGLVVETDQLHRRRFARTNNRAYLHLEGFGIAPGEPVIIRLAPLPARMSVSTASGSAIAAIGALLAIGFLVAPLRGAPEARREQAMPGSHLADEREAVLATIRSLEDDVETGKLSRDEHEVLRQELRAKAVSLLRDERAAQSATAPAAPLCAACGVQLPADARFCPQCGQKAGPSEAAGNGSQD